METFTWEFFNKNTGRNEILRLFLDGGSNITVITPEAAKRCGATSVGPRSIFLSTFGDCARKKISKEVSFDIYMDPINMEGKLSMKALVMDKMLEPINAYELSPRQRNFLKNNNLELADYDAANRGKLKIDLLVGQDFLNHFYKGENIFLPGGSILKPTWGEKYILAGPTDNNSPEDSSHQINGPRFLAVNSILDNFQGLKNLELSRRLKRNIEKVYSCISSEEELEIIDTFRNFELLGISPSDYEVDPIMEEFIEGADFDGERYWVRLPFKEPQIKRLSNNFFQAFSRLVSGHKRRLKPKYAAEREKYEKSFKDELERGILEKVETLGTMDEISAKLAKNPQFFNQLTLENGRPCCYLPHQAVYKASNGKFRRVHDGKARPYKTAYSLNDCLEKGPNLMSSILHILLGFRKNAEAAMADIEKAFPQVGIKIEDRDVLRCLWVENGQVVVYRFARLPFGLSCSPFILQATLRKHLGENNIDDQTMNNFLASIYVDDSVWSESLLEDLYKRKDFYTKLFSDCGMNFRDWTSNNKQAREYFAKLENREVKLTETVLGMKWDVENDLLRINSDRLKELIKKKIVTKRHLWKIIPSIYDPMGLFSPYILLGKLIVAEACKEVKNWDGRLPQTFIDQTLNWAREFEEMENYHFERFAGIKNPKRVQLYGCADASSKALGACVYLVSTAQDGTITSNLIMSKTRNAPPGEHSIPRLELAAAVLLVNVMGHVRKVYKVDDKDVVWFTDSADVIFWLYSGHLSWKPFVANQI